MPPAQTMTFLEDQHHQRLCERDHSKYKTVTEEIAEALSILGWIRPTCAVPIAETERANGTIFGRLLRETSPDRFHFRNCELFAPVRKM